MSSDRDRNPRDVAGAPPAASVNQSSLARVCRAASEVVILALVCLSPWAFGAVEAWAGFLLYAGVASIAVLGAIADWGTDGIRRLFSLGGLGLAGLALLAAAQAVPLPVGVLRGVDPEAAATWSELATERGIRVAGDAGPIVKTPVVAISRDAEATRNESARLLAAWILFQAVLGQGSGSGVFRRFGMAVTLNATLLSFFALIQWLTWGGKIYGIVPAFSGNGGPFLCHNHLAAYLNLGLGFALGGLLAPRRPGSRPWFSYAASLIVVGILASQSRSGFLAMLAAMAVTVLVLRPSAIRLAAVSAAVVGLVLVFFSTLATSAPLERVATLFGAKPFVERWTIWSEVARAWPSAPVLGLGLGAFPAANAPFLRLDRGEFFAHAENDYLEFLVEGGVVGLGLALLCLGATLRYARRVLRADQFAEDFGLVLGGLFGVLALAVQCLGDFPLHIPAIALTAVVLAGHLARLGLQVSGPPTAPRTPTATKARILASNLLALALVAASFGLVRHGLRFARAEAALLQSEVLPAPGEEKLTANLLDDSRPDLERMRPALERALSYRPDWAEGHLRLGLVELSLYARTSAELIGRAGYDPQQVDQMCDPLWLHWLVHRPGQVAPPGVAQLLANDPIRLHLVPAARSFLEARRCCPSLAAAHAELGGLDYLLEGGPPSTTHLRRALRWAGSESRTIAQVARTSVHAGDLGLAAQCLRKQLVVQDPDWGTIADRAARWLPTDQVLNEVPPSGRLTLQFAERLYSAPERKADRDRFLRAALDRLPGDADLSAGERLHLEAHALALLGEQDRARGRFEAALAAQPQRAEWRGELVDWLIRWGRLREAHDQAVLGLHFAPEHPDTARTLKQAAEALARGPADQGDRQP